MIGVCFGHQAMAQALGGEVIKSPKGWGVGLHRYWLAHRAPWIDKVETISIPASHQDQVVAQPPATEVFAWHIERRRIARSKPCRSLVVLKLAAHIRTPICDSPAQPLQPGGRARYLGA